jgi:hypothetical protein
MAHEDQFTATGPAFTGSGFSRAGFSTNRVGADFVHGVNVEGSSCGVFGQSVQQQGTSRDVDLPGTGVFGRGDTFGVVGKSDAVGVLGRGSVAGVRGEGGTARPRGRARVAGTGVIGLGGPVRDELGESGGAGVIGVGTGAQDPEPLTSAGAGVFGVGATSTRPQSEVGGTGVVGMASRGRKGRGKVGAGVVGVASAIQLPSAETTSGVGVYGLSEAGPGVVGIAGGPIAAEERGAPGVRGESGSGPGGEFSSDETGQVRLVPSKETVLPTIGLRGDLWMHNHKGRASKLRQPGLSLYICVQDAPVVIWQEVMLDPTRLQGARQYPEPVVRPPCRLCRV